MCSQPLCAAAPGTRHEPRHVSVLGREVGAQDEDAGVSCEHDYVSDVFGERAWDVSVCGVGLGCGEGRKVGEGEVEAEGRGLVEG